MCVGVCSFGGWGTPVLLAEHIHVIQFALESRGRGEEVIKDEGGWVRVRGGD